MILKEKFGPHKWGVDVVAANEPNVCDQESVEMIRMTKSAPIPVNDLLSFKFIAEKVAGGYEDFLKGTNSSANAWVESLILPAQKSIDEVWAAAK